MLTAPPNLYRWQDEKQTPIALVSEIALKFAIHNSLILDYSLILSSFLFFLFEKVSSPNLIQFSSVLPTFFFTLCLYSFRNKYKTHKTNYN